MSEHTPGPWEHVHEEHSVGGLTTHTYCVRPVGGTPEDNILRTDEANARRIVACVNACEGMKDPEAEIKALRIEVATPILVATNRLADALADARVENARLREALEWYADPDNPIATVMTPIYGVYCDPGAKARAALGKDKP